MIFGDIQVTVLHRNAVRHFQPVGNRRDDRWFTVYWRQCIHPAISACCDKHGSIIAKCKGAGIGYGIRPYLDDEAVGQPDIRKNRSALGMRERGCEKSDGNKPAETGGCRTDSIFDFGHLLLLQGNYPIGTSHNDSAGQYMMIRTQSARIIRNGKVAA